MNIWNKAQDIDRMNSDEWINYRADLIDEFYKRGHVLKPVVGCSNCDQAEDYTCFSCECEQINQVRGIES
jgi:hypothetical protein